MMNFLFFFFQAEDGIRDGHVTGVQTCALPIYRAGGGSTQDRVGFHHGCSSACRCEPVNAQLLPVPLRSEERRVGKECRSRWSPYHINKKKRDLETRTSWTLETLERSEN